MAEFTRSFDIPRFDKGRWYVIRPDGSEKDIDPLTAGAIWQEWQEQMKAAVMWALNRTTPG